MAATVAAGGLVAATRRWFSASAVLSGMRPGGGRSQADYWLAVTVGLPLAEVCPAGALPEPLARLGDEIRVRIRPAAGEWGTELLARPGLEAEVSRGDVRLALRQAKSLLEVGTVLEPDSPPSTHPGPAGWVLQTVVGASRKEGWL
ncbi:hypothetical protein [Parafrankia discariae]|uniref:hypothetical protein n=1 Tax=Parafrankia discariae TaxID=365528 RepID=UPI0003675A34|nr:hypothetical protein [Parafrankia discariae]